MSRTRSVLFTSLTILCALASVAGLTGLFGLSQDIGLMGAAAAVILALFASVQLALHWLEWRDTSEPAPVRLRG